MKARDRVYEDLGEGTWNLEVIRIFQTFTLCMILASEASQKKYNNKIKTTFGPPLLTNKHPHKTPPLTNLGGGSAHGVI